MNTVMALARGIGATRQAEARELALEHAVRLAKRERRLQARLARVRDEQATYYVG